MSPLRRRTGQPGGQENSGVAASHCRQISLSAGFNAYHHDRYKWPASVPAADDHLEGCYYHDDRTQISLLLTMMIIINGVAGRFH